MSNRHISYKKLLKLLIDKDISKKTTNGSE